MTIDGFLTFLALIVAVYAVMPRDLRLNIWLKVRPAYLGLLILAFMAVNALELYGPLQSHGWVPDPTHWALRPGDLAYLVVLGSIFIFAVLVRVTPLAQGKLNTLRDLVAELSSKDQYTELLSLLDAHLDRIAKIYEGDTLAARSRKWLDACDIWLPFPDQSQQLVEEIFRDTFLRPECVRALAQLKPYFALRIFALKSQERYEFSDEYLRQLMADRASILYWEIEHNQNLSARHRYALPDANRLLQYFFRDVRNAEDLGVWRPVGEYMIAELDRLRDSGVEDPYNGPLGEYRERTRWKCPLYTGIRFFDIMVSEAIDQDISWHMWLHYFNYVTERICRNYHLNPRSTDPSDEFPSPYSVLLYEAIATLRNWIQKVSELPEGQANAQLTGEPLNDDNGNPVKSSIFVLGECLRSILTTEAAPARLKRELASIALDLYFKFARSNAWWSGYAEVIREVLLVGGMYERTQDSPDYLGELIKALVANDNLPHRRDDVTELLSALTQRFLETFGLGLLPQYVDVERQAGGEIRLSSKLSVRAYTVL